MRQVDEAAGPEQRVHPERLLVITPTYDERENIEQLVGGVLGAVPDAQVLIVDDASPDGTGAVADAMASRDGRVHVLHRSGKLGLGTAYAEGFTWALDRGFTLVAQMDADGSHEPRELRRLLDAVFDGADVVLGSRNVPGGGVVGWGLGRHMLSKGGSIYARTVLGVSVRDMTTGFKVYRADALRAIDPSTLRSNGYAFQIETTYRAIAGGLRVVEVPIVFVDRRVGRSKMSARIFGEAVVQVFGLRLSRGARPRVF